MESQPVKRSARIAFIGNYLPRKCGIATFTTDLQQAVSAADPDNQIYVVALTDRDACYPYPDTVRFEIRENVLADYHHAAEFIQLDNPDVICVQHEYGIFGGKPGVICCPYWSRCKSRW